MGGKKTMEDSRRFEKHRRDKLNAAFEVLGKLLPEYDPSVTLSKIEILRKAAEYIKHLQQQNDEVLKIGSDSVLRDECENLKKKVANLLIKTKELMDALRTAGVPLPINKNNMKNKVLSNKNVIDDKQTDIGVPGEGVVRVRCSCMMKVQPDKASLKEVNSSVADHIDTSKVVAITPLSTTPMSSAADQQTNSRPILSSTLVLTTIPPVTSACKQPVLPQTAQVITIPGKNGPGMNTTLQPLCIVNNSTITPVTITTSSSVQSNQTIDSSTILSSTSQNTSTTTSPIITPSAQNVSKVDKNILPNLVPGTIFLTDGRIVNVPQIVPQFVMKQPPTVILMPTAKKKEKLLMPKTNEVTKTTFSNKAPITSIPSLEMKVGPKFRPKKRIKPTLKQLDKTNYVKNNSCELTKKRKLEDNFHVSDPKSNLNKTNDIQLVNTDISEVENSISTGESNECNLKISESTVIPVSNNSTDSTVCLEKLLPTHEVNRLEKEKTSESSEQSTSLSQPTLPLDSNNLISLTTSQSTDLDISEPQKSISSGPSLELKEACSTSLKVKTPIIKINISPDKLLNDEIKDSFPSLSRVSPDGKCDHVGKLQGPLPDMKQSVSIEIRKESVNQTIIPEKSKDFISNLPPCISSSAIQESIFSTTNKSVQTPKICHLPINKPSLDSDSTKNAVEESSDDKPGLDSSNKGTSTDSCKVDNGLDDPLNPQKNHDSSIQVLENSNISMNGLSINDGSSIQANKEVCSQEIDANKSIDATNSSIYSTSHSNVIEADVSTSSTSGTLLKENNHKQETDSLPGPVEPESLNSNVLVQSSKNSLCDSTLGSVVSTPISQQSGQNVSPSSAPSETNKEKNRDTFSSFGTNKNMSCAATPFISPPNSSLSAPSNIYSNYSSPYYSNETQTTQGTFPMKPLSTSSSIVTDRIDGFGNLCTSISSEIMEKSLYSQNIPMTQNSLLKNSDWGNGTCKGYDGASHSMWETSAPKQKSSAIRNISKTSEKDNELSQKGYYQDPSSFNSNLFSNTSTNNSSLSVGSSFADTPSLFSYHSSCSSAPSNTYNRVVVMDKNSQAEQSYNSNISLNNTVKSSDKHTAGYYPNNVPCTAINVSLPTTISMYSGFVQTNVYSSYSSNNTSSNYTVPCNNSSVQSLSQASSLFNHNSSNQLPSITHTFSSPTDVFLSNKSKSLMPSVSSSGGFTSKTNSFVADSLGNNVTISSSVDSNIPTGNDSSRNISVYTSSSSMRLSYEAPKQTSSDLSLRNSSLQSSIALTNISNQACGPQPLSSIETESMNEFNGISLITSTNNMQSQTNIYSASVAVNKSNNSTNRNGSSIHPNLFQSDTTNVYSNVTSLPISIPQSSGSVISTTSMASNKMPAFTQVSGFYSTQFNRPNLSSAVVSDSKSNSYCNTPCSSTLYSTSLPTSCSTHSSQTNNSRTLSLTTVTGPPQTSAAAFTNVGLTTSPNFSYKLAPLTSSSSDQNNSSSKSIQTNIYGMYSSSFQADGMRMLPSLPVQTSTLAPLSHSNALYTLATSAESTAKPGLSVINETYPRPQLEANNSFTSVLHSSRTNDHSNTQGNSFRSTTSFNQSNELNVSNNYHTYSRSTANSSQNELQNKSSSCLPGSNSDLSNSGGSECDQLLTSSSKKSVTASDLSSSSSSPHNSNNENLVNKQKKTDMNQLNSAQGNLSEGDCPFISNKDILSHNYPVTVSKDNSEISLNSTKTSHTNNEVNSQQLNKESSKDHESISKSNERDVDKYNSNHIMIPSSVPKKNGTERNVCHEKDIQSNSTTYSTPSNSNNLNSTSESSKQISNVTKSMPTESNGINFNCEIESSGNYSKNYQSHNVISSKTSGSSFQSTSYANYNSSTFDSITNQFTNGTLPLATEGSPTITNSNQVYDNASKIPPLDIQSEAGAEKQNKTLQKAYHLGNSLKSDPHLDLLKSKDLEKNTFIPIGYEDVRIPTDFSSDLFSSLQVPSGGQHSESISPTAAFLLAFPLVSTSRNVESLHETENHENHTSTPATILQIGNIDPPTTELFHPIDFQKNQTKATDQFDINNDYLQLPDLNEKQNVNYKRCDKRKDVFSDYGKEIRSNKQKTKPVVSTSSGYSQSCSNTLLPCNDYQFCEKESSSWHHEFSGPMSKEQKKTVDRKKDKVLQKGFYSQNYQDCFNYKDKKKKQQNRISVNWMSTPENREQTDYQPKEIELATAPPSQTVFTGISFDFPSESFSDLSNVKKTNNYSWSPSKSLLPSLDNHLMIPSTLPTLVGDLALGTNTPSESCKTFETPKPVHGGTSSKKTPEKLDENKKRSDFSKSQANFFSVSQLVDPKSKKQKTNDKTYRRPDKQNKVRNNFGCSKRKEDHCMYYEEKNSFISNGNQYHEKRNPYKGGSYSAESLIGAQSQELEFSTTFNYQQNNNYFQSDFTNMNNNLEASNQQYGYLQQPHIGSFNHEECQDFGFGSGQRNLETSRQKSIHKEDGYMRDGAGILPHLSSYTSYSKSLNYNLPPPTHPSHSVNSNTTNTLTNFNLSTIFPEMNDQRGANTGQPQQPINQSFPNSQNYRNLLPH